MKTIGLVACTSKKALKPTTAAELYRSPLFEGARWFAESRCDTWYILSAKYGLLDPDDEVLPYDESLNSMAESQKIQWAKRVYDQFGCAIEG
jgi:hypothetical protein